MMRQSLVSLVLYAALLSTVGCSAGGEDAVAVSETALSGARLANATVDDVVLSAEELVREHVSTLTAAHADIRRLTENNRNEFTRVGNVSYPEVRELIGKVLETQSSVAPSRLAGRVDEFLRPDLQGAANPAGVVSCTSTGQSLPLLRYSACERAEQKNAFSRARQPRGIDFGEIRSAWDQTVRGVNVSLDSWIVLPVAFEHEPSLAEIRRAAGVRVDFSKAGLESIEDFVQASECVASENPTDFAPIAAALRGQGIKKRFSFSGRANGDFGWSRHYLIVVDEHNQVWGFQSGYGE